MWTSKARLEYAEKISCVVALGPMRNINGDETPSRGSGRHWFAQFLARLYHPMESDSEGTHGRPAKAIWSRRLVERRLHLL